jgi:phage I-like protein
MKTKTAPHIAALSLALSSDGGALQLLPAGQFDAPRGALAGQGPWKLTAEAAARVIAKAAQRVNDMLIDYEHQSLMTSQNGKPVPAAGWIKPNSLHFDPAKGLLAAAVKWTDAAKASIAADEYRYISPVFSYDKTTGEVLDLINVALTNSPAIDGMDAVTLAAASLFYQPDEEHNVAATTTSLIQILGLAASAASEEVIQAVAALKAKADASDSKDTEIAALKAQTIDPSKFVPVAVVTELQTQLAALSVKQETNEKEQLIQANLTKLPTPGLQDWARTQSVAALTTYLANAPEVAALTGMQTGGKDPSGGTVPQTGEALVAACKTQWDSTPSIRSEFATLEDFTAYKKAEAAGQIRIHGAK